MVPIGVIALSDIINELTLFGSVSGNVIVIPPPPEVPSKSFFFFGCVHKISLQEAETTQEDIFFFGQLSCFFILDSCATGSTHGIQNE